MMRASAFERYRKDRKRERGTVRESDEYIIEQLNCIIEIKNNKIEKLRRKEFPAPKVTMNVCVCVYACVLKRKKTLKDKMHASTTCKKNKIRPKTQSIPWRDHKA
uniref:Uncharacterized protein n=1 Tax=Amphimedon queenslandica TaxID=400682 RepID=A0A1X7UU06_AMPQE